MTITPVEGVQAEKARQNIERGHPIELIRTCHLRMDDDWARILSRMLLKGILEGVEDILDRRVPVAVHGDLHSRGVVARHALAQFIARHTRISAKI